MTTTYDYFRTSRQRIQGTAGSDPEVQAHQLRQEGVPEGNIYRDVGVSRVMGTSSRAVGPSTPGWSREMFWWWSPSTGSAGAGRRPIQLICELQDGVKIKSLADA